MAAPGTINYNPTPYTPDGGTGVIGGTRTPQPAPDPRLPPGVTAEDLASIGRLGKGLAPSLAPQIEASRERSAAAAAEIEYAAALPGKFGEWADKLERDPQQGFGLVLYGQQLANLPPDDPRRAEVLKALADAGIPVEVAELAGKTNGGHQALVAALRGQGATLQQQAEAEKALAGTNELRDKSDKLLGEITTYWRAQQEREAEAARKQQEHADSLLAQINDPNRVSAAQLQQQQAFEQAIRQQQAAAASGPNLALAARNAAQNAGHLNASMNQNAALLRAQEEAQLRSEYAQALGLSRGQDLQGVGMGMGGAQQGMAQLLGFESQLAANQMAMEQWRGSQGLEYDKMGLEIAKLNAAAEAQWINKLIQIGSNATGSVGSLLTLTSDRRTKEDVEEVSPDEWREFFEAMEGKHFTYKPEHGGGERTGIMAQDLERSEIGRKMVRERDGIRVIDIPAAVGTSLAAQAFLARRIDALESKREAR